MAAVMGLVIGEKLEELNLTFVWQREETTPPLASESPGRPSLPRCGAEKHAVSRQHNTTQTEDFTKRRQDTICAKNLATRKRTKRNGRQEAYGKVAH